MKIILILLNVGFSLNLFADNNVKTDLSETFVASETLPYAVEPSFSFSSLNNGSQFMSVALTARLFSWFRLGFEGDLPATFNNKDQIFMARILGRIPLIDNKNKVYLQGALAGGFVNGTVEFSSSFQSNYEALFSTLEGMIGYSRDIGNNWAFGGRMGAVYLNSSNGLRNLQPQPFDQTSVARFYNRLTLTSSYSF